MAELNGNQRASSGSDITLSCSDGSSGLNSPREFNDLFLDTKDTSVTHNEPRTKWGWPLASTRYSITDDSINNERDSGDSAEKLNSDLIHLSRKAEVTDLELQTLRKQVAKESKRGQDLSKEVASLKEERDAFKEECEKLKASQKQRNKSSYEGNPWALLEEVRQELNHEKNLNVNLQLQLRKTQDSNSELILAVQDLEQMLEQNAASGNFPEKFDEEQKALEEIVKKQSDAKETYMLEQKIMDLSSEIEMYRRDKDELEIQIEQLALDYEILKQENHDMSYKLEQSHLRQQLKLQYECSGSYAAIYELENQVEKLERELNDRSNELSDSLATIKSLENHSQRLEDELENQEQRFKAELEDLARAKLEKEKQSIRAEEALRLGKQELEGKIQTLEKELSKKGQGCGGSDLEALIRAKEELEQRAIRAEEALRLTRWKNANMASRLQDEFKRLSMEMQSTFEANEKVAAKAMNEAGQLRLMNSQLEELLQQAKEETQSIKEDCEAQLSDLQKQLNLKSVEIDQLLVEIEEKTKQLDAQRENEEKVCQSMSDELIMLKSEIDCLASDTAELAACIEQGEALKAELELVKALAKERNLLERHNLECIVESVKKEAEKSMEELNLTRCLKDEKELALRNLQAEMDSLRVQCDELRRLASEDELEKDKLSKQVFQMKAEIKRKDEKELALRNLQAEMDSLRVQCEELRRSSSKDELEKDKLSKQVLQMKAELKKKDDALSNMERKLKDSNGRVMAAEKIKASSKNNKTEIPYRGSKEAASLRVKIKLLEGQIKQKETAMATSANAFHEKEKDLHNKIEELERRLQELMVYKEEDDKKVDDNASSHRLMDNANEALSNAEESSTINSTNEDKYKLYNDALYNEMESLKEKNSSMETELKELRERYSEISLKFAEVEGEREQLVMTLRNIKNVKKS